MWDDDRAPAKVVEMGRNRKPPTGQRRVQRGMLNDINSSKEILE
jgi:hypothetical protein